MTEHKTFIRKIKQGDKIRYAEVWNERKGKKLALFKNPVIKICH
ncbi:MAG: hypothetical protein U9N09_07565 [Euryarchaeota archaeon]|nr:hypothetical protein [Euryarchaeota archaeon]